MTDADLNGLAQGMQLRDASILMEKECSSENWQKEGKIMDIGCGPGTYVKKILLEHFPPHVRIVAMDIDPDMIEHAENDNSDERVEYVVADIEDRATLHEDWLGNMTNIVSIYSMHWMRNQILAFENVHELLASGGEASMVFVLSTPFWDHYDELVENKNFAEYLKDFNIYIPESHKFRYGVDHYREMLSDIGFEVLTCEAEERNFTYANEEVCKCACAAVCALTKYIPGDKDDFKEELLRIFYTCNGKTPEGLPLLYYTVLTLRLRKP